MEKMKTCSTCGRKAEDQFFHRVVEGNECTKCWQQRIKDMEELAERLGANKPQIKRKD